MRIRKRPPPPPLSASPALPRLSSDGINTVLDAALLLDTHGLRNESRIRRNDTSTQSPFAGSSAEDSPYPPSLPKQQQQRRPQASSPSASCPRAGLQHASASAVAHRSPASPPPPFALPLASPYGISKVPRTEGIGDIGGHGAVVNGSGSLHSRTVDDGHGAGKTRNVSGVFEVEAYGSSHARVNKGRDGTADPDRNGSSSRFSMASLPSDHQALAEASVEKLHSDQGLASEAFMTRLYPEDSTPKFRSDQGGLASNAFGAKLYSEVPVGKLHSVQGLLSEPSAAMAKEARLCEKVLPLQFVLDNSCLQRKPAHGDEVRALQEEGGDRSKKRHYGADDVDEQVPSIRSVDRPLHGSGDDTIPRQDLNFPKPAMIGSTISPAIHRKDKLSPEVADQGDDASPSVDRPRVAKTITPPPPPPPPPYPVKCSPFPEETNRAAAAGESKLNIIGPSTIANCNYSRTCLDEDDVTGRLVSSLKGHKRQRSVLGSPEQQQQQQRMRQTGPIRNEHKEEDVVGDQVSEAGSVRIPFHDDDVGDGGSPADGRPVDHFRAKRRRKISGSGGTAKCARSDLYMKEETVAGVGEVNGRGIQQKKVGNAAAATMLSPSPVGNVSVMARKMWVQQQQQHVIKKCKRKDGKGWQCKKPIISGSEYCAYHATKMQKFFRPPSANGDGLSIRSAAGGDAALSPSSPHAFGLVFPAQDPSIIHHTSCAADPTTSNIDHRRLDFAIGGGSSHNTFQQSLKESSGTSRNSSRQSNKGSDDVAAGGELSNGDGGTATQEDTDSDPSSSAAATASTMKRRWRKKCKPCMRRLDDIVNSFNKQQAGIAATSASSSAVAPPPSSAPIRRSSRLVISKRRKRLQHQHPASSVAFRQRRTVSTTSASSSERSNESKPEIMGSGEAKDCGDGAAGKHSMSRPEIMDNVNQRRADLQQLLREAPSSGGSSDVVVELGGDDHDQLQGSVNALNFAHSSVGGGGGELRVTAAEGVEEPSWLLKSTADYEHGDYQRRNGYDRPAVDIPSPGVLREILPKCVLNTNSSEWRSDHFRT